MDYYKKALELHREKKGKLKVVSTVSVESNEDMAIAYTPGVAEPCREIAKDKSNVYEYTMKGNYIAVISDGTAVLGLGNIGPEAAMPVMEGKCILFNEFAGINAIPICINTDDEDEIIKFVKNLEPSFGGINLEDISSPRCFNIERRLKEELNIPVFHDDQHGTAIVVLAGIINSLRLLKRKLEDIKVVINGAGAAGISIARLLLESGVKNIVLVDQNGALYSEDSSLEKEQKSIAEITNKNKEKGTLKDVIVGKDVFIGVSKGNLLTQDMIRSMSKDPIIFAMANPIPEIYPDKAKEAGARIVGTGRSDYPNQVNNVLVFPGIFRGALDSRTKQITEKIKISAAYAIAGIISVEELNEDYILPKAFDKRVTEAVARAVAENSNSK